MSTPTFPTPTQAQILRAAAQTPDGRITVPDKLPAGARAMTLRALLARGWIVADGDGHVMTDAGYAVAGCKRTAPPEAEGIQKMDTPDDLQLLEGIPIRLGTKLAALVAALRQPEGATMLQLIQITGWLPHSVGGALSGMVRKKLGLNVASSKDAGGEPVYRITGASCPASGSMTDGTPQP